MRFLRYSLLVLLSVLLSYTSLVFGAAPLFALRRLGGRGIYFALVLLMCFALMAFRLPEVVAPFGLILLLVFYFTELEALGFSVRRAGILAVAATALLSVAAFIFWAHSKGFSAVDLARTEIETVIRRVAEREPRFKLDANSILPLVPGYYVSFLVATLWLGLLLERRLRLIVGFRQSVRPVTYLSQFKLPNVMIWPAIAALAFGFIEMKLPIAKLVGLNVFFVFAFAYFLQGLAIVATYFRIYRVSPHWRLISYLLLVFQLFPAVSVLGVLDYWFDFRARFGKKSPEVI